MLDKIIGIPKEILEKITETKEDIEKIYKTLKKAPRIAEQLGIIIDAAKSIKDILLEE